MLTAVAYKALESPFVSRQALSCLGGVAFAFADNKLRRASLEQHIRLRRRPSFTEGMLSRAVGIQFLSAWIHVPKNHMITCAKLVWSL